VVITTKTLLIECPVFWSQANRILKVARTLADLAGKPDITSNEVLEAIQFRSLDRQLFD
jgi:predicted ATPase with chaperone activity